jgi:hypothetical protein
MDDTRWLKELESDFKTLSELFEELAMRVIEEGISRYPVFVSSPGPIALGVAVAAPSSHGVFRYYFMTTLEELSRKKILSAPAAFKSAFRNPMENACIILVTGEPKLVFVPYRTPTFPIQPVSLN